MKLKTVLIDDENKALVLLESKLKQFEQISIVGRFNLPEEAIDFLNTQDVELVFLDISMPRMSGFELLKQISEPNFELIMVTAHDEYAIEAIKHCAIGYVLKPIDSDELKLAVNNAIERLDSKFSPMKNKTLLENMEEQKVRNKKIVITTADGAKFFQIADIVRCQGYDGYTKIFFIDQQPLVSSFNIGQYVKMLDNEFFYQTHKSHLINLDFVEKYELDGRLFLKNGDEIPVSRRRRKEFLERVCHT